MPKMTDEDHRNLIAKFKGMFLEDIKEALKPGRHNFSLLIDNRTKNFAAGTLVRSFNIYSGKHIIMWQHKGYDRSSAVGAYSTEDVMVARDTSHLKKRIRELGIDRVIALENNINKQTTYLHRYQFDPNLHYLTICGNEGGIDPELFEIVDDFVEIKQFGSCKSLNLAVAGSTFMFEYCRQTDP